MKVLVTGGAGYIGSHVVRQLLLRGDDVLVLDNLVNGHREAVGVARLEVMDLSDNAGLKRLMKAFQPEAVIHFAAFIEVGESVRNPLKYYQNNTANGFSLLAACQEAGIRKFIFSSTAAVYGTPKAVPIPETASLAPINPYGFSKLFVEQALRDLAAASDFRYVALRYFNAAGADPSGEIGESHKPESHLIPLVLQAASGERKDISIFGTDYPTPDGTCVRDYVHVNDLADAHLKALDYLKDGGESRVFNCGYGHGYSVREVLDAVKRMTGKDFSVVEAPPRTGDPAELVADSRLLTEILKWKPQFDNLNAIIETVWNWELNRRY
ncbi:MAG: UDP-glucose 4-epimerase GalE [Acidobacteria bacterium]|nr:UDP-glucose 4-epimerase GalE [Acidobacteriota bacterium]